MKFANEAKVGLAIVVAAIVLFFGISFLADTPLFGRGYQLTAVFDDADGLLAGNPVRTSGVKIGAVQEVALSADAQEVGVRLRIDEGVRLPRGSYARIGGFSALGDLAVEIIPGPPGAPPLTDGDRLPTRGSADLIGLFQDNAERLFGSADTLLTGAAGTFASIDRLLADPEGDFLGTLAELRGTAAATGQLLRAERERIRATLAGLQETSANLAVLSADVGRFTEENADTLAAAVQQLNRTLRRVDASLEDVETLSASLDSVLVKLNTGQGTLGLMLNDPDLYYNANAALTNLNQLLIDFQNDPKRYLQELRLVDLF